MAKRRKNKKNSNVVRMNKTIQVNAALILFGIILLYVVASVIMSFRKESITTYKVNASNINNNITCDGVALREEKQISAGRSGYVCYFIRDGERVAKDAAVCTIDETGSLIQSVSMVPEGTSIFGASDYLEIRNTIDTFKTGYSDTDFYQVYGFKNSIESKVLEMSNQILMKEYRAQGNAVQTTVQNLIAPESGIITYYVDGYENLTPDTLRADHFDKTKYQRSILKTGDIVEVGNPLYKMISNEDWSICCLINSDQANILLEQNKLYYTINNSDVLVASNYDLIPISGSVDTEKSTEQSTEKNSDQSSGKSGSNFILKLALNKYMIDYVEDRFVSVEIILNSYEGLKVPNTAIMDKEVYLIPEAYLCAGANETYKNRLVVRYRDENGATKEKQIKSDYYAKEDGFYLVSVDKLKLDDVILRQETVEETESTRVPDAGKTTQATEAQTTTEATEAQTTESEVTTEATTEATEAESEETSETEAEAPTERTTEPKNNGNGKVISTKDEETTEEAKDDTRYTQEALPVAELSRKSTKGVYLANKGFASYILITIVKEGDEFTIVKNGESLREFDNIVMDAGDVAENQILY